MSVDLLPRKTIYLLQQLTVIVYLLLNGGLFVYNPVAPSRAHGTRECLGLVNDLVERYGPVKHIVLGSIAL
jgi:Domain of unknown function (DUF4336)